ncbi:MAG: DUF4184 family protein [Polyangiaceae bacterium]|nr:DUF4184 family protein [Polyangiaceae bacterium]
MSVLALWCGAFAPDAVDGLAGLVLRGHLGQWIGHSIVGVVVFSTPMGLLMTSLLRAAVGKRKNVVARWLRTIDAPDPRRGLDVASSCIGAVSHVVFDLVSHEGSHLLWPWSDDPPWLGEGWQATWFRVSVPGYHDYSIGPHFVMWLILSAGGAWMFVRFPPLSRGEGQRVDASRASDSESG